MYEVTIKKSFSAAHTLTIGGVREELHGHNFTVEVSVESDHINEEGIVVDFRILKQWLREIIDRLDHRYLNDLPEFSGTVPTAEGIARLIFNGMVTKATGNTCRISSVTVWESESARATYRENSHG
ncbi:MAG: 6-carboxytetrahydropterin synthase [Deltaproteobacteria bacterium]|nr:6-carboxytetrahydropterin synthase [Deltaproteobacteria bacterium]